MCDSSDGGGWTIVQQRLGGREDFSRYWGAYKYGFGRIHRTTEFWLGLRTINELTNEKKARGFVGFNLSHWFNYVSVLS